MSNKKEIEYAENLIKKSKDKIEKTNDYALISVLEERINFYEKAILAFKEINRINKPECLTIEELRGMNGEPVWCEDLKEWGIVRVETIGQWKNIPFIVGHFGDERVRTNFQFDVEKNNFKCYCKPI